MKKSEMDAYRELIRENIRYDDFVRGRSWDAGQLDETAEAVCSKREAIRVARNELPQAVVKSRLLKLDAEHIWWLSPSDKPPGKEKHGTGIGTSCTNDPGNQEDYRSTILTSWQTESSGLLQSEHQQ